jgi:hypothetical protein
MQLTQVAISKVYGISKKSCLGKSVHEVNTADKYKRHEVLKKFIMEYSDAGSGPVSQTG